MTMDKGGRFVAFGEVMLRLSPPNHELLMQSPRFDWWLAGAEANVATGLARLGHDVGIVTALPDNDLGRGALAALRSHAIDTRGIRVADGRMGLYFVTPGAGIRATDVVYDRSGSVFAETPPEAWDWAALLNGADRLHLSGITPALGPGPARATLAAAEAATAAGIPVSFDGNWRGKLWARWNGNPREILGGIVAHADLMFGNHRDIALLLGQEFGGEDTGRRRAAAEAAFDAYPKLQMIASTARHVIAADHHQLSARIDARDAVAQTDEITLSGIVDRIGAGDAFAAGVLHGLRSGQSIDGAARAGLALTCLKHSLPGDASIFTQADLDAFITGGLDVRR